jgi:hypothetical protein
MTDKLSDWTTNGGSVPKYDHFAALDKGTRHRIVKRAASMTRRHLLSCAVLSVTFPLSAAPGQIALAADAARASSQTGSLELTKTIPLPQLRGGFNHLAADAKRGRFYVTAPGDKKVAVVDLKAGNVLRVLTDVPASAAKYLADFDVVCLSGGGGVTFLNGESLTPLGKVELHSAVDELQYDAKEHRLYAGVMDAAKPGIAIIDAGKRQRIDTISLPAKPQGFVLEENGPLLYANTPGAQQVTVVDRKKRAIVAEWKLNDAKSNYPIALDEANHRLFIGCRRPPCLLVLDTASGNKVAQLETGGDTDDMSFDAAGKRIHLACGDGVISTISESDADHYRKLPDVSTVEDARNSMFVPELKTFFLAVPAYKSAPAELRAYQARSDR